MDNRRDFLVQMSAAAAATWPVEASAQARAGTVQTVLGPLDAGRLGFTLPHEHIADAPDVLNRWPEGGRANFVAAAVERLKAVRAAGIGTVADLTTYDVGRDIGFLEEVSRKSGLTMIAATGQRFFPPKMASVTMPARTIEGLAGFFIKEIERGIDGTSIRAGVIKIGVIGKDPTPLEEIGLRAAARASKASGVPIRTHTAAAQRAGERHAAILDSEGIDPARVCFDHSDDSGDMNYYLGLVKRGYSLGMDHVHRGLSPAFKPPFERRTQCIELLVDAGFADKIFLSSDAEFGGALLAPDKREWRETIDPPDGMLFNLKTLIPRLKQIGVPDRAIRTITVENPRRFFSRAS
jgi:phosphotriesterase-related protein